MDFICPCGSKIPYDTCCKKYHLGKAAVTNALDLLRSRYSAYVMNAGEYIIKTTHPKSKLYDEDLERWSDSITFFSENTDFEKLEILDFQDGKKEAHATFIAHLSQNGKDCSFQEKSRFIKENGLWTYFSAEL